jgi:hypothetical protein
MLMKRILGYVVLVFTVLISRCNANPVPEEPLRILFIGNSYTFYNDMPEIFSDLAESGGHEVNVTTMAKGGYSLADHAQDFVTRSVLESQSWDFVVLQEKSDIPALVAEREEKMFPYIQQLNEAIRAKGGKTILFMPWAYRDGFSEAGLPDYSAMQEEVAAGYFAIADELDLFVAPVGVVWQNALEDEPDLDLWMLDGKHPTSLGSFLAASVFYALIFNESPADLQFSFDSYSEDVGIYLMQIAGETVLHNSEN